VANEVVTARVGTVLGRVRRIGSCGGAISP
jgi:hypothetical protein